MTNLSGGHQEQRWPGLSLVPFDADCPDLGAGLKVCVGPPDNPSDPGDECPCGDCK